MLRGRLVMLGRVFRPIKRLASTISSPFFIESEVIERMIDRSKVVWMEKNLSPSSSMRIEFAEAQEGDEIMNYCIERNWPEAFGIVSWESSLSILSILQGKIDDLKQNGYSEVVVCDVGCGTGLLTSAAFAFGAKEVFSLDYNIFSLHFARRTFLRNLTSLRSFANSCLSERDVHFKYFDLSDFSISLPRADIYIFSDLLYTDDLATLVARRIESVLSQSEGSKVFCLVSDPKRKSAKVFMDELGFPAGSTTSGCGTMVSSRNAIRVQCVDDSAFNLLTLSR